jgi:hypothetical protein
MSDEHMMESLWPRLQRQEDTEAPVAILRQQAVALGKQTRNVLEGYVRRMENQNPSNPSLLSFSFEVVAPGLGDYRIELLRAFHNLVPLYPVKVDWNGERAECDSEEAFKARLREIFNAPSTQDMLQSLLDQSFSLAA